MANHFHPVRAGRKQARWPEADLRLRHESNPVKMRLAAQLRQETTMTLKWIARRLQMGTWTHLDKRHHDYCKAGGRS